MASLVAHLVYPEDVGPAEKPPHHCAHLDLQGAAHEGGHLTDPAGRGKGEEEGEA